MPFTWPAASTRGHHVSPDRRRRERALRRRSALESLEDRTVLSTFTWNGSASALWSTNANWTITGGLHPGGPNASDDVVFDATSSTNSTVDVASTVNSVSVNAGYAGALSLGANLTVNAGYTQSVGTFNANSSTLTVAPTLAVSGGTFNAGSGTVVLKGDAAAPGVNFNNVTVAAGGNFVNVGSGINVNGTLDLQSFNALTGDIHARGDVTTSAGGAHVNQSSGTIIFDGTGPQSLTGVGVNGYLPNVQVNKTGTLSLIGDFNLQGDWTNTSGTVNPGSSTITLVGSATTTLSMGAQALNNLVVAKGLGHINVGSGLYVNGTLDLQSFNTLTGDIHARGNVNTSAGGPHVNSSSGKIILDGTIAQSLTGAPSNGYLPNVQVNKNSGTLSLFGDFNVQGNWTNTKGAMNAGASTVTFVGGQTATVDTGTQALNDVVISMGSHHFYATRLNVGGNLTINNANTINAATGKITVGGNLTSTATTLGGNADITMVTAPNATITGGAFPAGGIIINKLSGSIVTANVTTPLAGPLTLLNLSALKGTFQVAGDVATHDTSVAGNADNSPVLQFLGSQAQQIITTLLPAPPPSTVYQLPGLSINKPGGSLTLPSAVSVSGDWIVDGANAGNVIAPFYSTVVFALNLGPNGSRTIDTGNSAGFFSVILASGSGSTLTVNKMVTAGDLTISNVGTIKGTIEAQGNVYTSDTSVVSGPGTILFNGTGDQSLISTVNRGQVPNVKIDKPSGKLTLGSTNPVLNQPIGVSGGWNYVQGNVDSGTSTVVFNGYGNRTVTTVSSYGSMQFYNLVVSIGSGDTLTVSNFGGADLKYVNSYNKTSGTVNGNPITVVP